MEWLGRYSMTDVMVLALMIFYVNSSGYTEARVLPGVYFFAASALITMLAYGWANTAPNRYATRPHAGQIAGPSGSPVPKPITGDPVALSTHPARRWRG
jgi:paraquat-inducible protein A